jgi:CCR4-NOT transcription complex subunit 2
MKLNPAWTSPQLTQSQAVGSYSATPSSAPNGNNNPPSSHLVAPPGVPLPPGTFSSIPQSSSPYAETGATPAQNLIGTHSQQHPQTPAQQVLVSAADRWGLLGLLAMIKNSNSDLDQNLTMIGSDLGTMGMDMGYAGCVSFSFLTLSLNN